MIHPVLIDSNWICQIQQRIESFALNLFVPRNLPIANSTLSIVPFMDVLDPLIVDPMEPLIMDHGRTSMVPLLLELDLWKGKCGLKLNKQEEKEWISSCIRCWAAPSSPSAWAWWRRTWGSTRPRTVRKTAGRGSWTPCRCSWIASGGCSWGAGQGAASASRTGRGRPCARRRPPPGPPDDPPASGGRPLWCRGRCCCCPSARWAAGSAT